ncbi:hypothetical protein T12_11319 [Trichinella patagoniensis]|uniref:Uncharacterized protein n=1 Tax=Trichinella patagoniensis TaxID=990121 RepID=A0A0V1A9I1_9BILA|nr:hypothetical protein T12_11319 [Trichinella patagoniensis]
MTAVGWKMQEIHYAEQFVNGLRRNLEQREKSASASCNMCVCMREKKIEQCWPFFVRNRPENLLNLLRGQSQHMQI